MARKPSIQCPEIPAALQKGIPPAGSAQWCAWIDDVTEFVSNVGTTVGKWIDTNLDPVVWRNQLATYQNQVAKQGDVFSNAWGNILHVLIQLIDMGIDGFNIVKDLISCAWNWNKIVFPKVNPAGYLGVAIMRTVLRSINNFPFGFDYIVRLYATIQLDMEVIDNTLRHLQMYLLPMNMPSVGEATSAWTHGYINVAARDCVWKYWGFNPDGYEQYAISSSVRMGFAQAMEYVRRGGVAAGDEDAWLLSAGVADPKQRDALRLLYDRAITETQALQWTRSNTVSDAFANKYGLDSGFDVSYWPRFGEDLRSQGITKDIAALNYRNHWQQLGIGQLQQMLWKLTPLDETVKHPFRDEDYQAHLEASGYSPQQVQWLMALRYRYPSVVEVRELYYRNISNAQNLRIAYMNEGLSPTIVDNWMVREQIAGNEWRARNYGGWTAQSAGKAFAIGLINHAQVTQIMVPLGANAGDIAQLEQRSTSDYKYRILQRAKSRMLMSVVNNVRSALRVGVMDETHATDALVAAGWPAKEAAGIAQIETASGKVQIVKTAINKLRSAYLNGEITAVYAQEALAKLGVVPDAIKQYMAVWGIENTPNRKRRAAKQIVTDLTEGAITTEDATARLVNLGYPDADRKLFLADALRSMVTTDAARQAALSLTGRDGSNALVAAHGKAVGLSNRIVAELKSQSSPAKLKSYYTQGFLTEEEVRFRLSLYNWQPDSIDLFMADAQAAKDKKNAPKATTGKAANKSSTSTGSDTLGMGSDTTEVQG